MQRACSVWKKNKIKIKLPLICRREESLCLYFVPSIIRGSLSSSSVQQCYFMYISYPHNDSFVFSHRVLIKKENEVWGKKELIFINWAFCTIALLWE